MASAQSGLPPSCCSHLGLRALTSLGNGGAQLILLHYVVDNIIRIYQPLLALVKDHVSSLANSSAEVRRSWCIILCGLALSGHGDLEGQKFQVDVPMRWPTSVTLSLEWLHGVEYPVYLQGLCTMSEQESFVFLTYWYLRVALLQQHDLISIERKSGSSRKVSQDAKFTGLAGKEQS